MFRLTPKQRGTQENFCIDRALIENYEMYMKCVKDGGAFDHRLIFRGVKLSLNLKSSNGHEKVAVTLGRIISRQAVIIGRHTCVVEATSDYKEWKGKELVVKISWPAVERESEAELVKIAREKARTMETGKKPDWALDHLPDILLCQDFGCDEDSSTQANIAAFCKEAECAENMKIEYEQRVCRITVQERLYPLQELRTVEEYAQVFFDILQIHKWLYDHPRILHRDISPGNIMWRRTSDGQIRGVLNDFDLSSLRDVPGAFSLQCTGTLPYMAYELLIDKNGQPPKHLYRHDVESIFYVILLLCCRYKVLAAPTSSEPAPLACEKAESSPFDEWYTLSRATLKSKKVAFIMGDIPTVNSGFVAFQPWLNDLHGQFAHGQLARIVHSHDQTRGKATGAFDEETLQNKVSYSIILGICSDFAGSPLVARNDQLEVTV
ncbi:hypothetical protein IW261DRAFT_1481308 [Armillaria novae-zelandiae]|uniref:Protein kinase domain-containing protein n=1 Tax=Armillaria novae-zelandiae TaxID=153914 RepID=A0AA39P7R0_9AGAR|nr:hypothetical protein IW261DRAFT_1481308 [Armillaria novae-zelandiae]